MILCRRMTDVSVFLTRCAQHVQPWALGLDPTHSLFHLLPVSLILLSGLLGDFLSPPEMQIEVCLCESLHRELTLLWFWVISSGAAGRESVPQEQVSGAHEDQLLCKGKAGKLSRLIL